VLFRSDRVTDLDIIRWRTTIIGSNGQLKKDAAKHRETKAKELVSSCQRS
jgi:hypothetical protein